VTIFPNQPVTKDDDFILYATALDMVDRAVAQKDEQIRKLREALEGMTGLFRSICLMRGWDWNDYAECNKARAALKEES
jgi:hypothetical protein